MTTIFQKSISVHSVLCSLAPVTSLTLSGGGGAKKRLVAPSLSLTLNRRDSNDRNSFSAAALSGTPDDTPSLDINLEALETPSDSETGTLPDSMHDLEWDGEMCTQMGSNVTERKAADL